MTADKVIKRAIEMLGLNDIYGSTGDARLQTASLSALNTVYADLFYLKNTDGFQEISDISEPLSLDERTLYNVMPYGVAAYIAQSLGDTDSQQFFSILYNSKRKTVVNTSTIQDMLPAIEG